ncbi:MAG: hypothetical protein HZA01_11155 [Nitrospinae bacterium]|nr:hypothetical protein [Nitrospinota bacterium]
MRPLRRKPVREPHRPSPSGKVYRHAYGPPQRGTHQRALGDGPQLVVLRPGPLQDNDGEHDECKKNYAPEPHTTISCPYNGGLVRFKSPPEFAKKSAQARLKSQKFSGAFSPEKIVKKSRSEKSFSQTSSPPDYNSKKLC